MLERINAIANKFIKIAQNHSWSRQYKYDHGALSSVSMSVIKKEKIKPVSWSSNIIHTKTDSKSVQKKEHLSLLVGCKLVKSVCKKCVIKRNKIQVVLQYDSTLPLPDTYPKKRMLAYQKEAITWITWSISVWMFRGKQVYIQKYLSAIKPMFIHICRNLNNRPQRRC